jgi:predicted aminopeptidase
MRRASGRRGARAAHCAILVVVALSWAASSCSPLYVLRAGAAESRILSRRRPIVEVMRDPATSDENREKLRLVTEARDYARRVLDLDAGDSFRTYSWVESDTLLLVVSASRKDRFEPYTWWFPIVGHVPYKGFFDFDAAHREARTLDERGYDTYVRPSPAFSTLGFFDDPLLNTTLRASHVALAATVIHELLHNTVFIPSAVAFNESFASFVGDRGAIDFFCSRDGPESATCTRATQEWQDNLVFGEFLTGFVDDLDALYSRSDLTPEEKVERRGVVFTEARVRFDVTVEPLLNRSFRRYMDEPLNNATLIGTRLYYRRLDLFERIWELSGRDLRAAVTAIRTTVDAGGDPWPGVEALADSLDAARRD